MPFAPAPGISQTDVQRAVEAVQANLTAAAAAEYLVATASGSLSAERVTTDTTSITWDHATLGQAKAKRAALSGDVSAPADDNTTTLATVNANVGSFGSASAVATFTVNAKGLVTAAGSAAIQIAISAVTNLQTTLDGKVNDTGDTMTGALTISFGGGTASSTKHLELLNGSNWGAWFVPKTSVGSYNPLTQNNDTVLIFSGGAIDTGALLIAPWTSSSVGLRMTQAGAFQWSGNTIWHAGNDGNGSGLDADLLNGFDFGSSGNWWGIVPNVGTDGVMEIGKFVDFHNSDADATDYAVRLHTNGGTTDLYIDPAAGGTNIIYRAGGTNVAIADGGTNADTAAAALSNLGALGQGLRAVWIPKAAMKSRTTNGAASGTAEMATNKNMFDTFDFDPTTQEFVQFAWRMPKSWNEGTVTFAPVWSHPSTTTNFGVVFGLAGVAISNDDAGDVAFGTAQTSTDTGGTTNDIYQGPTSSAITIAGSPAADDFVMFQINRTVADGSDTMAVDARLHGIVLFMTLNAVDDT